MSNVRLIVSAVALAPFLAADAYVLWQQPEMAVMLLAISSVIAAFFGLMVWNEWRKGPLMATNSDYRPDFARQAKALCEFGATDVELAEYFAVTSRTIYTWKHRHSEFGAALKVGKEAADERVIRALYHRALGYTHSAVKIFPPKVVKEKGEDGKVTVKVVPVTVEYQEHFPPDTLACIYWLKNRQPEKWKDVQKHEIGKPGEFSRLPDDELVKQLQLEAEELGIKPPSGETVQ